MEVLSQVAGILQEAYDKIEVLEAGDYAPRVAQIQSLLQRQVTQIKTNAGDDPLNSVAPHFPPLVLKKDITTAKINVEVEENEQGEITGLNVLDAKIEKPSQQILQTPQQVEAA